MQDVDDKSVPHNPHDLSRPRRAREDGPATFEDSELRVVGRPLTARLSPPLYCHGSSSVRLTMRLEEEQIRELWRIARRRDVPVSALIREAVRRFLSLDPWEEELRFIDRRGGPGRE